MKQKRVCPRCGRTYSGYPAISRKDNKTEICSQCGTEEALQDFLKYAGELLEDLEKRGQ